MTQTPQISIIMPCYNAEKCIETSIDSVYRQTFKDFELIVVNDGSTDDSLSILQKLADRYSGLRVIDQPNKGPGPARNHGIKEATGQFIAFLDSDDSWHPDCLAKLHRALQNNKDASIAYCGWQNMGLEPNHCKPFIPPDYEKPDKIETLLRGCRWPIHGALTRKSVIDKAEGFDEQWTSCMDYDLWLRIASFNKVVLVPEVLSYYHHHDGEQITKNRLRIAVNHWKIQLKFLRAHPEIAEFLGSRKISEITDGELLHRAYVSYWRNDLQTAHTLFRKLLFKRYFKPKDLKYLLPTLLPFNAYQSILLKLRS
ncbi:glycosyltransferase family 2 protein [Methylotuvimicrobium sp.]|uniref:glycosyltransferase family 2 protein n=1 Tax=Methylotuvimicrobium sp. TaxID=2822413 RepID=UPI003D649DF1